MAGLDFERFEVGWVLEHAVQRTETEADNVWFSTATLNPAARHLDEPYCKEHTEFGPRIANSACTFGLMTGPAVQGTTLATTVANLGMDEVRFPEPVFHGDAVRAESEVPDQRASTSRPKDCIVTDLHGAFNQENELVAHCKRSALMLKRPTP